MSVVEQIEGTRGRAEALANAETQPEHKRDYYTGMVDALTAVLALLDVLGEAKGAIPLGVRGKQAVTMFSVIGIVGAAEPATAIILQGESDD